MTFSEAGLVALAPEDALCDAAEAANAACSACYAYAACATKAATRKAAVELPSMAG